MHHLLQRRFASTSSGSITSPYTIVKHLVSEGLYDQALQFYKHDVYPLQSNTDSAFIIPSIAKACAHCQTHKILGVQIHCNILKNGLDSDITISNSLISMYAKFSDTGSAQKLFDEIPTRDAISWNSMINCYIQNGFLFEGIEIFREMPEHGFMPKPELIASVLSTCVQIEKWRLGRSIHALVVLHGGGVERSVFVSTALVDFYWSYGDADMAFRVFEMMEVKNEVSWTAMISGCIKNLDYARAFDCTRAMQFEGLQPNRVTLISVLPACIKLGSVKHGKEIHGYAVRRGYDMDPRFSSALVHIYCECEGTLRSARLIFDRSADKEVTMWSSMIGGYSRRKDIAREAIRLFDEMVVEGILPNSVTLLAVMSACTTLLSLRDGRRIQGYTLKSGLGTELSVQNALINMFSKCGSLEDCVKVFDDMEERDCVSWSAIIGAYGLYGYAGEALRLFYEMQNNGVAVDALTYLVVLSTCNHAGLVDEGQLFFDRAVNDINVSLSVELYACYVDILGRAGKVEAACDVVCRMPMKPSPRIWSSLVSACKLHGRLGIAESLANRLVSSEPENPANYTLLSMVYAECDNWHAVEEVRRHMMEMKLRKNHGFSEIQGDNQILQHR